MICGQMSSGESALTVVEPRWRIILALIASGCLQYSHYYTCLPYIERLVRLTTARANAAAEPVSADISWCGVWISNRSWLSKVESLFADQ